MSIIPHNPAARSGFTLIEVLVALAIAAVGLAFFLSATGVGLQNATIADQYVQATRRAQSRLAQVGRTLPLKPGNYSGDDGEGFGWQVTIAAPIIFARNSGAPAAGVEGGGAQAGTLGLFPIDIRVRWRSGLSQREVSLHSERVGPQ